MSPKPQTRLEKAKARSEAILDAAAAEFVANGFAAARVEAAKGSDALRAFRGTLPERADRALDDIAAELERIAAGADVADDDFPGFAPADEQAA